MGPKFRLSCLWVLLDLMAEAAEMLHGTGKHRAGKWGFLGKILGGLSTWFWGFLAAGFNRAFGSVPNLPAAALTPGCKAEQR